MEIIVLLLCVASLVWILSWRSGASAARKLVIMSEEAKREQVRTTLDSVFFMKYDK